MKLGARTTSADPVTFPTQENAALPNVSDAPSNKHENGKRGPRPRGAPAWTKAVPFARF